MMANAAPAEETAGASRSQPEEGASGDPGQRTLQPKSEKQSKCEKCQKGLKNNAKGACLYLYNPKTRLCCGRNCKQWACLLAFLATSYTVVAFMFSGLLGIVMLSCPLDKPQYVMVPDAFFTSKIQQNPGLIFVPEADQITNPDSAVVVINEKTRYHWGQKISTYLKGHDEYWRRNWEKCNAKEKPEEAQGSVNVMLDMTKDKHCYYMDKNNIYRHTNQEAQCNLENFFGYSDKSGHIEPTFIVRLSRVWGWEPKAFDNEEQIREKFRAIKKIRSNGYIRPIIAQEDFIVRLWWSRYNQTKNASDASTTTTTTTTTSSTGESTTAATAMNEQEMGMNGVFILCDADSPVDKDLLGHVTYCMPPFIPGNFFPFRSNGAYISPFILLQFRHAAVGIPIKVTCFPFAKNIEYDGRVGLQRKGMESFEFMIN